MKTPKINTHLKTSNIVVRRQIVRDNIARLRNFKNSKDYIYSGYFEKKEFAKLLDAQIYLCGLLTKEINKNDKTDRPINKLNQ